VWAALSRLQGVLRFAKIGRFGGWGWVRCVCQQQIVYVYLASVGFAPDPSSRSAPGKHGGLPTPRPSVPTLPPSHSYAIDGAIKLSDLANVQNISYA